MCPGRLGRTHRLEPTYAREAALRSAPPKPASAALALRRAGKQPQSQSCEVRAQMSNAGAFEESARGIPQSV
eukprot:10204987-Alexandrium_andersonii.AAC.1